MLYFFIKSFLTNGLKSLIFVTIGHRPMEQVSRKITCKVRQKNGILPYRQIIILLESESCVTLAFGYENTAFQALNTE